MAKKIKKWYMTQTSYDDVVVTSRVRLARNLSEFPFQERLGDDAAAKLVEKVRALTPELTGREGTEYYSCNLHNLSEIERRTLVECHSVSPGLAAKKQPTGLIVSEDESISIMINEEDHLRIQSVVSGNDMRTAFRNAERIDDFLDSRLHYSFSDKYGYLTSCMTNTGTGLRASYMLSLPGITVTGKLNALQEELRKYGIVLRGLYGEGTKSSGFMYQISNQKTLGITEQEILENLDQVTGQVISLEHKTRDEWFEKEHDNLEDKSYRSYGILKYTRSITTIDAMTLLGQVKLGSDLGALNLEDNGNYLHRLMVEIQPAGIQNMFKRQMDKADRDRARAEYLNKAIPKLV